MAVDAIEALASYLVADPAVDAIVAGWVFGGELPDRAVVDDEEVFPPDAMPRAVVVVSDAGGTGDGGDLPLDYARVDVKCYAETPKAAKDLAIAVHRALRDLRRHVAGDVFLHSAVPSGGFLGLRDPSTRWPLTLRSYQVLHDEREVA